MFFLDFYVLFLCVCFFPSPSHPSQTPSEKLCGCWGGFSVPSQ